MAKVVVILMVAIASCNVLSGSTSLWDVIRWPEPVFAITLPSSAGALKLRVVCVPRLLPTGTVTYQWIVPELSYTVEPGPRGLLVVSTANSDHVFEPSPTALDFRSITENLSMRQYGQNLELKDDGGRTVVFREGSLRSLSEDGMVWRVKHSARFTWLLEALKPGLNITIICDHNANVSEIRSGMEIWRFEYDAVGRLTTIRDQATLAHFDYDQSGWLIGGTAGIPFQLRWAEIDISGGLYGASHVRRIVLSTVNKTQFLYNDAYLGTNPFAIGVRPPIN